MPAFTSTIISDGVVSSGLHPDPGGIYISSGGVTVDATLSGTSFEYVSSGGIASATTIQSGGTAYVSKGGIAVGTTVSSAGILYVESGGTASGTAVDSGGYMFCMPAPQVPAPWLPGLTCMTAAAASAPR